MIETRTVGATAAAPIPRSFAGFSMEYWSVKNYIGATRPNPIFARLVQTLADGGNGAPTIRLGGNSTDESWWNPTAAPRPPGVGNDITPASLGVLGQWAGLTRTPLVLGLNLRSATPRSRGLRAGGGHDAPARHPPRGPRSATSRTSTRARGVRGRPAAPRPAACAA